MRLNNNSYYWVVATDHPSVVIDLASVAIDGWIEYAIDDCQNRFTICCNRWFVYATNKTSDATYVLSVATDGQYV